MKRFGFFNLLLVCVGALSTPAARAASLSFDVAARVLQNQKTAHTFSSRVFLKGEWARLESGAGDQKTIVLWRKPYIYRLLPATKSGVRFKASTPPSEMAGLSANWPRLMNDPGKIRVALQSQGAKKIGTAKIAGVLADVYAAKNWRGQGTQNQGAQSQSAQNTGALRDVKIWLRHADSLPLQLTGKAQMFNISVRWSNYHRNAALSDALFQVPKGFHVREIKSAPASR